MVFTFHKFTHYLLSNKFVFYVDHMALVYLMNKPKVSGHIARWFFFFWSMNSKLEHIHVVANVLSRFLEIIKLIGIPNQTIDVALFQL
jgi:hypothetical protein